MVLESSIGDDFADGFEFGDIWCAVDCGVVFGSPRGEEFISAMVCFGGGGDCVGGVLEIFDLSTGAIQPGVFAGEFAGALFGGSGGGIDRGGATFVGDLSWRVIRGGIYAVVGDAGVAVYGDGDGGGGSLGGVCIDPPGAGGEGESFRGVSGEITVEVFGLGGGGVIGDRLALGEGDHLGPSGDDGGERLWLDLCAAVRVWEFAEYPEDDFCEEAEGGAVGADERGTICGGGD